MIITTNFNNTLDDMKRYHGKEDIRRFCRDNHLDGLEYMRFPYYPEDQIPMDMVQGIHLSSFECWMDLWLGNQKALLDEFGSMKTVEQVYGGTTPETLIRHFQKELDFAETLGVKYVVFHVSEVKVRESFTRRFCYTDHEVISAASDLINEILRNREYTFDFLMENLWWAGLTLTKPEITEELLTNIRYDKTGIMLDTGHLLHTNLDLRAQSEGVDYILQVLDQYQNIMDEIWGIHLQQSLTGDVARLLQKQINRGDIMLKRDYWERYAQVYPYVFSLDQHKPFTDDKVMSMVEKINPKYLTFEFITKSRAEHEQYLREQWAAFCRFQG